MNNDIIHNQIKVEYIIAHETLYWNTIQEFFQIQQNRDKPQLCFKVVMYIALNVTRSFESWEEFQYLFHDGDDEFFGYKHEVFAKHNKCQLIYNEFCIFFDHVDDAIKKISSCFKFFL